MFKTLNMKENKLIKKIQRIKLSNYLYSEMLERLILKHKFLSNFYEHIATHSTSRNTIKIIKQEYLDRYKQQKEESFNPDIDDDGAYEEDLFFEDMNSQKVYEYISENLLITLIAGVIANLENQLKEVIKMLMSRRKLDSRDKEELTKAIETENASSLLETLKVLEFLTSSSDKEIKTINEFRELVNAHKHGKGRASAKLEESDSKKFVKKNDFFEIDPFYKDAGITATLDNLKELNKNIDSIWETIRMNNTVKQKKEIIDG